MSDEELRPPEPLDDDIEALLRNAREPGPVPAGAKERVAARLGVSVGMGIDRPSPRAGGRSVKVLGRWALVFGAGAIVGSALTHVIDRGWAPEPASERPPTTLLHEREASGGRASPSRGESAEAPRSAPRAVVEEPRAPKATESTFDAERLILDEARHALTEGQTSRALSRLKAHESKHPNGTLTEEREALTVRALASAGRTDEANIRGKAFLAAYPESLFGSAVEAAMARAKPGPRSEPQ